MKNFDPEATGPLEGLRILDLSRLVAGNTLSLMLADFGADVVKVEDPGQGDALRDWRVEGVSIHWKVYGRNKRSIALNLRTERGRGLLLQLVETADGFIESFKTGTLEKLGLGPDVLLARNPRLVIVRVSGWGQTGAYSKRPGFGTLVEAFSGFAAKNGFPDRPPVLPNLALADQVSGLCGAFATMVALRHAEKTGMGQVIDLSLLEPLHSILGPDAAIHTMTGRVPQRSGSKSTSTAPRNVYRTKDDRYIAISASMQSMAARVFEAIGRPGLIEQPGFRTHAERVKNPEVDQMVADFIAARTLDESIAIFEAADVTAGPVYDPAGFAEDPHVKTREVLIRVPDEEIGEVVMHNIVPRLSESPGQLRRPAPEIGEDTADVLGEIGIGADELHRLAEEGVIQMTEKVAA